MTKKEYFLEETGKHIRNVQLVMNEIIRELCARSRTHDASKFDDEEADLFSEVSPELSKCEFGSDEYKTNLNKIRPAILRHNQLNPHHPEHYDITGISGMTLMDLLEMIADWMAASKRNLNGNIEDSIEKNQRRFEYSDELKRIFLRTVRQLHTQFELMEEHDKYVP